MDLDVGLGGELDLSQLLGQRDRSRPSPGDEEDGGDDGNEGPHGSEAGEAGLEPTTPGFGDRCSAS